MASDNQVTLVGNLTDDPELRYTPNGAAVCKFRIAVNRRIPDGAGGWKDGEASYFSVNCWRSLGENVAESLTRGSRVVVAGRLNYRSWENQDGEKRNAIEIEADEVGPSLRWATARVERQSRARAARARRRLGRDASRRRSAVATSKRRTTGWRLKGKAAAPSAAREKDDKAWQKKGKRKFCIFCKDRVDYIDYKDTITLRKFVSERGKLRARRVTGNCVQHQRDVASAVKNAREMALMTYSSR